MGKGTLYGVGVGPGDPELITVRAMRVLRETGIVAFFAKKGEHGRARTIAAQALDPHAEMLPLIYPFTVELSARDPKYIEAMKNFYGGSADRIASFLDLGKNVAVICEGDPLLYGSYMYLHDRLHKDYPTVVIPGISSYAGCAAAAGIPMVSTDRVLSIVPGTLSETELENRLRHADAAVILKLGRNLAKVRRVLERLGKAEHATYFEHGTTPHQAVMPLRDKPDDASVYFSLVLVPGHDGGPYRPDEGSRA